MLAEVTNWWRLYGIAALTGAVFGLLLGLGMLPSTLGAPVEWSVPTGSRAATVLLTLSAGVLVALLLASAAHLGVRWQLRRSGAGGANGQRLNPPRNGR